MEIFPTARSARESLASPPLSSTPFTTSPPTAMFAAMTSGPLDPKSPIGLEHLAGQTLDTGAGHPLPASSGPRPPDPRRARMIVAGTPVDLCGTPYVLAQVRERLAGGKSLAIGSVNLDHIHHFGGIERGRINLTPERATMDWLLLADGMPIVERGNELTGTSWPRLTGSDLLPELLSLAEELGRSVGFLGGTPRVHELLRRRLGRDYPRLRVSGYWAPDRENIDDPGSSTAIADSIREAQTDIVVVSLGKPRQELWIEKFGDTTDARVFLAFGAATDFLAGQIDRAPQWLSDNGFEWLYRLVREPGRLAHRYLVEGPQAWVRLRGSYLVYDTDYRPNGGK